MPKQKIPSKLKKLSGTYRADRDQGTEIEIDPARPSAPEWMTGRALSIFDELADDLAEKEIIGEVDKYALVILAGCIAQVEDQLENGLPVQASLLSQVRGLFRSFGLTPCDRASLNLPAPVKEELSGFAALARNGI
jgi:phage terminase small subunit